MLLLLGVIWAAFLLPPLLRARTEHRPNGSIVDFRRQLHVLGRAAPPSPSLGLRPSQPATRPSVTLAAPRVHHPAAVPSRRTSSAAKRRRDVFFGLLALMAGSLVLSFVPAFSSLLVVHLVLDALFAAYVGALVYLRNLAAEREMKVRFMPPAPAEPALVLRQSAR